MSKERKRNSENKGLPLRWQLIHGAYYYRVPPGLEGLWGNKKRFRLGKTLDESYGVWTERMAQVAGPTDVKNIGDLLDRYTREVIPTKAISSQTNNRYQLPMLREVFGAMPLLPFKPQLIYQYVDHRSRKRKNPVTGRTTGGKIIAHREIELLSHAFTKAVEWGYIDRHPFKFEIRLIGESSRDRYIEDWEIVEVLNLPAFRKKGSVLMIQAYLRIKLLTGMAQGDLLRLQPELHIKEDGIHNQRHKTAKKTGIRTIYEWSPKLRAAVDMALAARPRDSAFLFCNYRGQGYINETLGRASGWKSMWQHFMARVIKETKIEKHFTEHDMRAKVASDAESLEHAQALLAHADSKTTKRIYRRKAELVKPLG
jgi:hypothetical protein